MIDTNQLADAFERNVQIIKRQCEGLTHEESLYQAPFHINCLNWVLGHIVDNRDGVLKFLGAEPALGDAGARYQRNSEPVTDDGEGVLPLAQLLELLERGQAKITTALRNTTPETLNREIELFGHKDTVAGWLFTLYFHDAYHTGQTDLLRQISGKNDKII